MSHQRSSALRDPNRFARMPPHRAWSSIRSCSCAPSRSSTRLWARSSAPSSGGSNRLGAAGRGRDEDLLDRQIEQLGDAECERQRGIIFAGLDRVHALARHFEALAEILLAPVALGAEEAEAV